MPSLVSDVASGWALQMLHALGCPGHIAVTCSLWLGAALARCTASHAQTGRAMSMGEGLLLLVKAEAATIWRLIDWWLPSHSCSLRSAASASHGVSSDRHATVLLSWQGAQRGQQAGPCCDMCCTGNGGWPGLAGGRTLAEPVAAALACRLLEVACTAGWGTR